MVLNIFASLFVIGITFMHSMFGLFSGIINTFCTITALVVSLGSFEVVNRWLTGSFHLHPGYTEPFSLVLLFVITLGILRYLADNFVRGNVRVPMYADWGGGAVCGFINAQVIVGVMVLGFAMLPFGGRVMMFQGFERPEDGGTDRETGLATIERNHLFFRSDEFAVGLFEILSAGSLEGQTSFARVYPDFSQWVWWTGNQIQPEVLTAPIRDEDQDGFENGLRVEEWWVRHENLPDEYTRYRKLNATEEKPDPPFEPFEYKVRRGRKLVGARLTLKSAAADHFKESRVHRFRPTNIRLVGDIERPDGTTRAEHYYPRVIGGADPSLNDNLRVVNPDGNFSVGNVGDVPIDVYFDVPEEFEPRFIEYRRHARAPVIAAAKTDTEPLRLAAAGGKGTGRGGRATGVSRFLDTIERSKSGDIERLPFPMGRSRIGRSGEIRGERLAKVDVGRRIAGTREALSPQDSDDIVRDLHKPEGMRIFQIAFNTRKMESLAGQVMNFVGSTTNQYRAVDKSGTRHELAGYYALVKKNGQDYIEFFFTPRPQEVGFRGMVELDPDTRKLLRDQADAVLGLIYVVPPGTCIYAIESQGGRNELGVDYCVRDR